MVFWGDRNNLNGKLEEIMHKKFKKENEELKFKNKQLEKEISRLKCINNQLECRLESSGIGIVLDMGECE